MYGNISSRENGFFRDDSSRDVFLAVRIVSIHYLKEVILCYKFIQLILLLMQIQLSHSTTWFLKKVVVQY